MIILLREINAPTKLSSSRFWTLCKLLRGPHTLFNIGLFLQYMGRSGRWSLFWTPVKGSCSVTARNFRWGNSCLGNIPWHASTKSLFVADLRLFLANVFTLQPIVLLRPPGSRPLVTRPLLSLLESAWWLLFFMGENPQLWHPVTCLSEYPLWNKLGHFSSHLSKRD